MKKHYIVVLSVAMGITGNTYAMERLPQNLDHSPHVLTMEENAQPMPLSAELLIGHISAALLETDHKMQDAAIAYLEYARQDIINLEKEAPDFKSADRVRVGRLDYILPPQRGQKYRQARYVLFPFRDGNFAVQIPDLDKHIQKQMHMTLKDAQAMFVHVNWDIAATKGDLEEAQKALNEKDYIRADKALQAILNGDIKVTQELSPDVLQSVYDHVMLADSLFLAKDYTFSRYALYHAQSELKNYAFCEPLVYDDQVRMLGAEIQTVAAELRSEDPTVVEKIRGKIRRWIDTLRLWINPKARTGTFIKED